MKQILGNRQHGNVAGIKDHDVFFCYFFFFEAEHPAGCCL